MTTLKNVMLVNAISSGATGLLLVAFPSQAANLFGTVARLPFVLTGLFLLLFACFVFVQSKKRPMQKRWIKWIVAIDVLWVLESLIIVFPKLFGFSALGYVLITAVAFWVALMAILQARGLRQFLIHHPRS